jgi:hypothetical protein
MSRDSARSAVLAALLVGLLCLTANCADLKSATSTTQQAVTTTLPPVTTTTLPPPVLSEDGWLMGVALGDTISRVIERLGEPHSVGLPEPSEECPDRQLFSWLVGGGDYGFSVTSDSYDYDHADYRAEVCLMYLWVKGDAVSGDMIDSMALGKTTRAEVEELFGSKVQPSGLGGDCLMRHHSGRYIFYFFDDNGVLREFGQTAYDPESVN